MKRLIAGSTAALILVTGLSACSWDKATQPFQDAPRTGVKNNDPADVVTMPDGFNNMATKCDHGNRVYVTYHGDSAYGSIAVVPTDPTCVGS
jgi:hypothetical protein